jgi:hypothetical protein
MGVVSSVYDKYSWSWQTGRVSNDGKHVGKHVGDIVLNVGYDLLIVKPYQKETSYIVIYNRCLHDETNKQYETFECQIIWESKRKLIIVPNDIRNPTLRCIQCKHTGKVWISITYKGDESSRYVSDVIFQRPIVEIAPIPNIIPNTMLEIFIRNMNVVKEVDIASILVNDGDESKITTHRLQRNVHTNRILD